jgi:hypothetical protein
MKRYYATILAALVGAGLGLASRSAAAETASSQFRVEGTITPAAAGQARGPGLVLDQIVAQPEPFGESAGVAGTVLHGWRFPRAVARLYRYALAAGWSLRGAPGLSDQTTGHVFTGPAGAPIKIGNLQYPSADGAFVQADDSDPILGLQAFWVFSYWGGQGQVFGTPDAHQPGDGTAWQELLQPGWNLFSPPYAVTVPPRGGDIVVVWRWDTATAAYAVVAPGEVMRPLEGYWLFVLDQES